MADERDAQLYGEPSAQELLADPIAGLLMRYDGITVEQVWAAIRQAQARLGLALPETSRAA